MNPNDILIDPQWIAFQAMLDENPASHETRAVLADWLENFGHPWARAYRWMFRYKRYPYTGKLRAIGWYYDGSSNNSPALQRAKLLGIYYSHIFDSLTESVELMGPATRINAELALCRQFHKLPLRGKKNV